MSFRQCRNTLFYSFAIRMSLIMAASFDCDFDEDDDDD